MVHKHRGRGQSQSVNISIKDSYKRYQIKTIIALVIIIVLFYIFTASTEGVRTKTIEVKETVPIKKTETYTVNEPHTVKIPYNETEYYTEKVGKGNKYCDSSNYLFLVDNTWRIEKSGSKEYFKCFVEVTNQENQPGEWTMHAKFIITSAGGGPESDPQTFELGPFESKTMEFEIEKTKPQTIAWHCEHVNDVVPVKEEDCVWSYYQDVRKKRIITKYREEVVDGPVEKTREVVVEEEITYYKNETVTVYINRVFGYEQPFNLGY